MVLHIACRRKLFSIFLATLVLGCFSFGDDATDQKKEEGFRFRFVGPKTGNRVAAIAGIPGDVSTYYAGAASGGVFKSTDGGNRWEPIFDKEPAAAIGALAVAASDPSVVFAGTGEAWAIREPDVAGNGIYKSTDAGKTWTNVGLGETGRIGRIVIHPRNPDIVFVCALGRLTGPQQERGVYRTTDGGQHWERVLFADENTGCSGLAMDAENPRVLFAGMWQVEMHTYAELSGGAGSGVYVSRDGGTKWTRLQGHGLPKSPVGKVDVAVAPSDSSRIYALIQTADQGSLWRSDDGGESWSVASWDRSLIGRAGYYIRLAVSPTNENEVLVASSDFHQSLDGGRIFRSVPWGGDTHDIWFDPMNADRFVITDDAGLIITTVHGRGFHRVVLPIGQMYHVAVDNQVPYFVYTNMQDGGAGMRWRSTPLNGNDDDDDDADAAPPEEAWDHHIGGCESGFTVPDPTDPNVVWATCYGDEVTRWDARNGTARSVSPWLHTLDSPPNGLKYRCHWTPPLAIDPFDHNTVYYGCQEVLKTTNGGQSWSAISPDLSTQDPSRIIPSGGIVGDNLGQFYGEVVYSIAPSKVQKGLIWAGTNDGQVWYTEDGGGKWNNVTKNISGMAAWGTITSIQPSFFDAATAYISVDFHLMDNRDPYVYKTADRGLTWKLISADLPKHALSYVRVIAEDPNRKGLLFAGTGNGVYYSPDDGGHWSALDEGLPHAPVSWAVVQPEFHDLVVSTYGRGIYILDDISALEQQVGSEREPEPEVRLFAPRSAYRFSRSGRAGITFSLKAAPKAPVKFAILDADNKVLREWERPGKAGLNRTWWDLHHAGPRLVELRTTPAENPNIWIEPRFWGKDSRPVTHWGLSLKDAGGPIALPGKYTVRITVDDKTFTQPFDILRDPHSPASDEELKRSVDLQISVCGLISDTADLVNHIEWVRKQLDVTAGMLRSSKSNPEQLKSAEDLNRKLQEIEHKLVSNALTMSDDKYFVESYQLYFNLVWLYAEIGPGGGDVAGGADFAPTDTEISLMHEMQEQLTAVKAEYAELMDKQAPLTIRP
jgi:photosystem II stability/assembly factor-like uncharacterized protein